MKIALTIAGSDSGGGAGIQADLKTFAAHGVHAATAVSAVTAQNSVRVAAYAALDPAMVVAQIETVASDMPIAALKTGMLANRAIITAVAEAINRIANGPIVVDPVMVAKSGDRLLAPEAERAYVDDLFPIATIITPNLAAAAALLGRSVRSVAAMRDAARDLRALGPQAVLVKGGHLAGEGAPDVLCDGADIIELPAERVATVHTQGSGCTLSAAICARLARGEPLRDAVRGAKEFVTGALRAAYATGRGRGTLDQLQSLHDR
jgi:hydroxymethylpyrimidine/phosphomethylpyrimidine kinase